jgi:NAD+ kinase
MSLDPINKPIKNFGLFVKWRVEGIKQACEEIIEKIKKKNCAVTIAKTDFESPFKNLPSVPAEEIGKNVDCILVLGGDGTMLYAARFVATRTNTPVIGVHLGQLGFMTQIKTTQFDQALQALTEGRYRVKERMILEVSTPSYKGICMNEVVLHREHIARIIDLRVKIQGMLLSTIRGDGIIVATPQGSTAYSLSAGGPIVHPAVNALTITSLCPHALTNRPVVVPSDYVVTLEPTDPSMETKLHITLDGQDIHALKAGDTVTVKKSPFTSKLIDLNTPGKFFETLSEKLHWGI